MSDRPTRVERTGEGRRRPLTIGLVVAVVLAAGIAVVVYLMGGADLLGDGTAEPAPTPQAPAGSEVVAEFSGEGDDTTDEFEVTEGWEIRWETTGETFNLAVTGEQVSSQRVLNFDDGPGGGSTRPAASGTLQLEIESDGGWSVLILEHEDEDDEA